MKILICALLAGVTLTAAPAFAQNPCPPGMKIASADRPEGNRNVVTSQSTQGSVVASADRPESNNNAAVASAGRPEGSGGSVVASATKPENNNNAVGAANGCVPAK